MACVSMVIKMTALCAGKATLCRRIARRAASAACAEGRAADRLKALTEADDGRGERHDRAGAEPHARQNGRAEPGGYAGKQRGGHARRALAQQRRQAGAHDLRKDGARETDAAKRRADQLAVAQGVGEQNG